MAGITVSQLAQWRLKNVNLKIFEKNEKPTGTVGFERAQRPVVAGEGWCIGC
jgi:hypothetical protein